MQQPPDNQPWQQPNTQYPPQEPFQQWQQPPMMPPPPPMPPKKKRSPWLIVGIIVGTLILCGAIGNVIMKSSPSAQATPTTAVQATSTTVPTSTPAPTDTPSPTPKPTQAPKWVTVQTFSGTGDKQTSVFTVPGDWKIVWSCDATHNYGVDGAFVVEVYNSDGTPSDAGDVNSTCTANQVTTDSTEEHQAGSIYLKILSSVPWKVQIQKFE